MPNIFISYRREETAYLAATIADKLANKLGKGSVFLDIDNIPMGVDFRKHLGNAISRADLVLVLIGESWLTCTDLDGSRRLDSTADFVRIEIEAALRRGITIVPVLLENAKMPRPEQLPESIRALAFRNATELRAGREFLPQLQRLVNACEKFVQKKVAIEAVPLMAQTVLPNESQRESPKEPLIESTKNSDNVPGQRTLLHKLWRLLRFILWMERPSSILACIVRVVFLVGAILSCLFSVVIGLAIWALPPATKAETEQNDHSELLGPLVLVGFPWFYLYLLVWLPGRLIQFFSELYHHRRRKN